MIIPISLDQAAESYSISFETLIELMKDKRLFGMCFIENLTSERVNPLVLCKKFDGSGELYIDISKK